MKYLILLLLLLSISLSSISQTITGKVVNASNGKPLEYASIGIINTRYGTITNENGKFKLIAEEIPDTLRIRFSMLGYEAKIFKLKELVNKQNIIKLKQKPFELAEVIIKPSNKYRKVGTTTYSMRKVCGWEGSKRSQGHEIGTEIKLGDKPVRLESLHVHLDKQSFDSSMFRLHIRTIKNRLPDEELLNEDILIPAIGYKGWIKFNLSKYNIVLKGNIALSLEWLKVLGLHPKKLISVDGRPKSANVLFSMKKNKGNSFTKWGVEDRWRRFDKGSPSFYLTVQE